jgi:hypothetical protein
MNHKSVLTYFINFLKAGSNGTSVSPAYYGVTPAYTNWQFIHIIAVYTNVLYSLKVWTSVPVKGMKVTLSQVKSKE